MRMRIGQHSCPQVAYFFDLCVIAIQHPNLLIVETEAFMQ